MFRTILLILNLFVFFLSSPHTAQATISIFHNRAIQPVHQAFSPDGKHFAVSGDWYVRIWDTNGNITGEYFDKNPRTSFRKEWKFWDILRSRSSVIAFINNKELAIIRNNNSEIREISIVGLDGIEKRTLAIPGKKYGEGNRAINIDNKQGHRSPITQLYAAPDGNRIITVEPHGGYLFVRDKNFKEIKAIRLMGTDSYSNLFAEVKALKFLPDSSGFILQTNNIQTKDGWNGFLFLYDKNGNKIKNLLTDGWGGSCITPHGKVQKNKDDPVYTFRNNPWDISPDGKNIIWPGTCGKIDTKKLGYYEAEDRDLKGRFNKKEYQVALSIRKLNIHSGINSQIYILQGGDTTKENYQEREPYINPDIKQVFYSKNGKELVGWGNKGFYHISINGKIKKFLEHPKIDYLRAEKWVKLPLDIGTLLLSPNRKEFVNILTSDSLPKITFLDNQWHVKKHLRQYPLITMVRAASHDNRFLAFMDGKGTILWDLKTNEIKRKSEIINWDNWGKEYLILPQKDDKTLTVKFDGGEFTPPKEFPFLTFPNRTIGVWDQGLIILDKDGNPKKKYARSTYQERFAMHPSVTYFMAPSVNLKLKTMSKVDISGKFISKFWIGSFISTVKFSPDGTHLIGSQDNAGCISIWTPEGKLINPAGNKEGRLYDLFAEPITNINMTKDNRYLITATPNGTLISDLKTGRKLRISLYYKGDTSYIPGTARLVQEGGGLKRKPHDTTKDFEFIASDTEGRFECSEGVKERLSIMEKGKTKTKKLWNKYFTENLVWKFMQGE